MTLYLDPIRARLAAVDGGEAWIPIPIADGYEVSNFGHVRSWWMRGGKAPRVRAETPHVLRSRLGNKSPYHSVSLPKRTQGYGSKTIHSLVMLSFVGPRPEGFEVAHLDGDPGNNRLDNLAYVTHSESEGHKRGHGTWGRRYGGAILTVDQVAEIKCYLTRGFPQSSVAHALGLSPQQVSDIARRKTWPDVPPADLAALLAEVERLRTENEDLIERGWADEKVIRDLRTVSTVADLRAEHLGQVIACNGWQGRLDIMSADRPGWVALTLAALDPADRDVYTVVPLTEPVRIEDHPTPAVVDLLGALRASVEAARARREARP